MNVQAKTAKTAVKQKGFYTLIQGNAKYILLEDDAEECARSPKSSKDNFLRSLNLRGRMKGARGSAPFPESDVRYKLRFQDDKPRAGLFGRLLCRLSTRKKTQEVTEHPDDLEGNRGLEIPKDQVGFSDDNVL